MIFLETERLFLRSVEERDEAVMFDYRNDISGGRSGPGTRSGS